MVTFISGYSTTEAPREKVRTGILWSRVPPRLLSSGRLAQPSAVVSIQPRAATLIFAQDCVAPKGLARVWCFLTHSFRYGLTWIARRSAG